MYIKSLKYFIKAKYYLFLLVCTFFISQDAYAEKPLDKADGMKYYENCMMKHKPMLKRQDSLNALCACAAARYTTYMSVEDVLVMRTDTLPGRMAQNKMLLEVLTPCLEYPVSDILEEECLTGDAFNHLNDETKLDICLCASYEISEQVSSLGREFMRSMLVKNPTLGDPIDAFMNNPQFLALSRQVVRDCIQTYQ